MTVYLKIQNSILALVLLLSKQLSESERETIFYVNELQNLEEKRSSQELDQKMMGLDLNSNYYQSFKVPNKHQLLKIISISDLERLLNRIECEKIVFKEVSIYEPDTTKLANLLCHFQKYDKALELCDFENLNPIAVIHKIIHKYLDLLENASMTQYQDIKFDDPAYIFMVDKLTNGTFTDCDTFFVYMIQKFKDASETFPSLPLSALKIYLALKNQRMEIVERPDHMNNFLNIQNSLDASEVIYLLIKSGRYDILKKWGFSKDYLQVLENTRPDIGRALENLKRNGFN